MLLCIMERWLCTQEDSAGWVFSISVKYSPNKAPEELPSFTFISSVWMDSGRHSVPILTASHTSIVTGSFSLCAQSEPAESFLLPQYCPKDLHPQGCSALGLDSGYSPGDNWLCSSVLCSAALWASIKAQLYLIPTAFKTNTTTACMQ